MLGYSLRAIWSDALLPMAPHGTREIFSRPSTSSPRHSSMMSNESPLPEPKPTSIQLSCPVCNGMLMPLAGNSAVKALERHLERDHWYSRQGAHDAASDQFALQKAVLG